MTAVPTASSAMVVASGDDMCRTRCGSTCSTYHGVKRTHAGPEDDMPLYSKVLSYCILTVGDAKETDMTIIKDNSDIVFKKARLFLVSSNHEYDIEYAVIKGVTYLKTLQKYESYEFEQIFRFGYDCHDFVEGKVVVVRPCSF